LVRLCAQFPFKHEWGTCRIPGEKEGYSGDYSEYRTIMA